MKPSEKYLRRAGQLYFLTFYAMGLWMLAWFFISIWPA